MGRHAARSARFERGDSFGDFTAGKLFQDSFSSFAATGNRSFSGSRGNSPWSAPRAGEDRHLPELTFTGSDPDFGGPNGRRKREGGKREGGKREGGEREGGEREGGKFEGGKFEGGERESGKRESGKFEGGKFEGGRRESGKREGGKFESGRRGKRDVETRKDEPGSDRNHLKHARSELKDNKDFLKDINNRVWHELRNADSWEEFLKLWREFAGKYPGLFDWSRLIDESGQGRERHHMRHQVGGGGAGQRRGDGGYGGGAPAEYQRAVAPSGYSGEGGYSAPSGYSGEGGYSSPSGYSGEGGYSAPSGYSGEGGYSSPSAPASHSGDAIPASSYTGDGALDSYGGSDALGVPWQAPDNAGDLSIAGPPTISARQIDDILTEYGSPAAGLGSQIYSMCVDANIDPAIALGFFIQESSAGTDGIATQTKSWGNIRDPQTGGFKSYPNFLAGLDDWLDLMNNLYLTDPAQGGFGAETVDEAIPIYAPASDGNNPQQYINTMRDRVMSWREDAFSDRYKDELPRESDNASTEKRDRSGTIGLNDNTLDFFFTQFKSQFKNNGQDSSADCGPASLAMVFKRFGFSPNGVNLENTPELIRQTRIAMTGDDNPHGLTDTDFVYRAAVRMDPNSRISGNFNDVDSALSQGKMIVMAGNPGAYNSHMTASQYATDGAGGIYRGGHFITVVGGNGNQFLIHDPASKQGPLVVSRQQLEGYFRGPHGGAMVIVGPPAHGPA